MMATATVVNDVELEEPTPMTDREHLAAFGWAWDDPDTTEVDA